VLSLRCWFTTAIEKHFHFLRPPTIRAWDLGAGCRILPIEQEVRESQILDELKRQLPLLDYLEAQHGGQHVHLAAADGWGCALCTTTTSQVSW
jgi:hypothetical protein